MHSSDLLNSLQSLSTIQQLPLVSLARLLQSSPSAPLANDSNSHRAALQAWSKIALPTSSSADLLNRSFSTSNAPTANNATTNGAGAITRLFMGLIHILDQYTPTDAASSSSSAHPILIGTLLLIQQFSAQPALRASLLTHGVIRVLAKLTILTWLRVEELQSEARDAIFSSSTPSLSSSQSQSSTKLDSTQTLLTHCMDTLLAVTQSLPLTLSMSPFLAALINRLGTYVIEGDQSATTNSAAVSFIQALALLGNFVAQMPLAKTFIKSNTGSAAKLQPENNLATSPANTSTSLTIIPLKSLYRQLISFLSSSSMALVLHSLRLVSHLAVNDGPAGGGMERKLFSGANLETTFQLVFNLIIQNTNVNSNTPEGGQLSLLRPAINILLTLIQSGSLLVSLKDYSQLLPSLKQLFRLLNRASNSTDDTNVAVQLLELFIAFGKSRPLAPLLYQLLFDDEVLEAVYTQWFSKDIQLATLALQFFQLVLDANANQLELLQIIPSNIVRQLSRYLTVDQVSSGQRSDQDLASDLLLVEAALRENDLLFAPPPSFVRQPSLSSATPPTAAAYQKVVTHHAFILLIIRLFIRFAELPVLSRSLPLQIETLQELVTLSLQSTPSSTVLSTSSPVTSSSTSRSEETFALLHLLSLLAASANDSKQLIAFHQFLLSLPEHELAVLLGSSLTPGELDQHAIVEDGFIFIRMWLDAQHFQTLGASATKKKATTVAAGPLELSSIRRYLAPLVDGLQTYSRSSSRDVHRLNLTISSLRTQLANLTTTLNDLTTANQHSASNHETREYELQQKMKQMEQQFLHELEMKDQQIREMKVTHATQLQQLESTLNLRLTDYHSSQQIHYERFATLETELLTSQTRSSNLEKNLSDFSHKYKVVVEKLKTGGEVYKQLQQQYQTLQQSNTQLHQDYNTKSGECDELKQTLAQHQQDWSQKEREYELQLEDSYGKLILLNRTLQAVNDEKQQKEQSSKETKKKIDELTHSLSTLQNDHDHLRVILQRSELELANSTQQLHAMTLERDELQSKLTQLESELDGLLKEHQQLQRAHDELTTRYDHSSTLGVTQSKTIEELQLKLDQSQTELKQHHQLAAMIHKLSGTVAATGVAMK